MSIDFEIPEDAKAVRARVRQWVEGECIPAESKITDEASFKSTLADLRAKARAEGLWCPFIPKEYGGMGLGPLANALVQMELGRSHLGALSMNSQGPDDATMLTLLAHGTEHQKEKYLKPLLNGEKRVCYSMTEKAAGADATGMRTTAVKQGNENYVLNGEKWFSSAASAADLAVVMARTDPDAPRHQQFSTFIVELPNPGYIINRDIPTMAAEGPLSHIMGGGHSEVIIKDLVVPAENLLGGEGQGFNMGQHRLAYGRLRHGMHNVAMAQRALDMAVAHITQRETFGKKVSDRQAVQFMVAECASQLYIARLMLLHIAYKAEKGHGSPPGKRHRQGLPRPHGPPRGGHRHPAARGPGLQPRHPAGRLVHPHPQPAPGGRPRRGPPLDHGAERDQGLPRHRHHRRRLRRRPAVAGDVASRRRQSGGAKLSGRAASMELTVRNSGAAISGSVDPIRSVASVDASGQLAGSCAAMSWRSTGSSSTAEGSSVG
jgi:acyl-CoA dehydrogenase